MLAEIRAALPLRGAAIVLAASVVSACAGTDSIDPLASASFNHHNTPPSQPTSLKTPEPVVSVSGNVVTVSWPVVAGADEYQVVSTAPQIHTPQTSATSVTGTVANGTYTVKVRARTTSSNNESGFSAEKSFTVAVVEPVTQADNTPPVIAGPFITGTLGNNGWYTSDVQVTWTATDNESPVTLSGCSVSVTENTAGSSFTCTATSAGGSATSGVTIKLDETVPSVSFSGNAAGYTVDQFVGITCSASDAMSGLAASNCPNASGAAYDFTIGSNVLSATALDNAGNRSGATAGFTVSVTSGSMCNLVRRFVSHHGIANSLCVKLDAAAAAEARGNLKAEAGALNAFALEVKAQTGKHITAANAAILLRLVAYL